MTVQFYCFHEDFNQSTPSTFSLKKLSTFARGARACVLQPSKNHRQSISLLPRLFGRTQKIISLSLSLCVCVCYKECTVQIKYVMNYGSLQHPPRSTLAYNPSGDTFTILNKGPPLQLSQPPPSPLKTGLQHATPHLFPCFCCFPHHGVYSSPISSLSTYQSSTHPLTISFYFSHEDFFPSIYSLLLYPQIFHCSGLLLYCVNTASLHIHSFIHSLANILWVPVIFQSFCNTFSFYFTQTQVLVSRHDIK
jgi:hypothetical protein